MSQYTSAMNTNDGRSALISDIASANATVHAQQVRRCHVLLPIMAAAGYARTRPEVGDEAVSTVGDLMHGPRALEDRRQYQHGHVATHAVTLPRTPARIRHKA